MATSVLCWSVCWRLLQGIACACLYTASAALVGTMFPEDQRGRALGLLLSANGLGLALGPVVGGVLVDTLGWRWIFLLNVPLILVSVVLCVMGLPRQMRVPVRHSFDWLGAVLLLLVLPSWIVVAIHGADLGWTSARTSGLVALGAVLTLALVWVERRAPAPLLRWHWFTEPRFVVAAAATAALAFFYCAAFFMMPLYLSGLRHQSAMATGWWLLPTTVLMAAVSPLAGRWADRFGTGRVMALGFLALLASALLQATLTATTDWLWVLLAFACMGVGWGGVLSPSMSAALSAFTPQHAGNAIGMATTVHNLGGVLGLAAATVVLQWHLGGVDLAAAGDSFSAGYRTVMCLLAGVCGLALLVLLAAARGRPSSGTSQAA